MTMSVLTVGTGEEYATIQAAVAAATSGDTIDVNAGTYAVADLTITQNLTFVAVGGTVDIAPPAGSSVSEGLFVVGTDTSDPNVTIEGFSFSGATTGAGIRYQSGNLTLDDDSFSGNQYGVLATPFVSGTGTIDVNDSVFNQNSTGNLSVGEISTFVLTNSTSEDAGAGGEVNSGAENNTIEDNQILDGPTGTARYSIDLPNGGNDIIQGNTIEKGPDAGTPIAIYVGSPTLPYVNSDVVIQGNTFINNTGGPSAVAVKNEFTAPVTVTDNTMGSFANILQGMGTQRGNLNASGGTIAASTNTTPFGYVMATINLSNTSGNHTETLTLPNWLVIGGSGHLTVIEDATLETVYGGSGGVAVSGDGGQTVYTKAGSTNTIQSNGNLNTYFSFGNDSITVSGNSSNYDIYGTAHVTGAATASDTEASYIDGTENFAMRGAAETFTIFPGGTANINGTAHSVTASENEGTVNFNFTLSTNSTVFSGSLIGGQVDMTNGAMTTYKNTTRATIELTKGTYTVADIGSTISGGGATVQVTEYGGQGLTFIGGSGSATLNTDSGGATVSVGSGSLQVNEHANDGPITYNFDEATGGRTVTINDFRASEDTFAYSGFTGNPIQSQSVSGGSLHLTLQNHTTVVLLNETQL